MNAHLLNLKNSGKIKALAAFFCCLGAISVAQNQLTAGSSPAIQNSDATAVTANYKIPVRVIDETTGKPLADAAVTVESGGQTIGSGTTDADGRFTVNSLESGKYDLRIEYKDHQRVYRGGVPSYTNLLLEFKMGKPELIFPSVKNDEEKAQVKGPVAVEELIDAESSNGAKTDKISEIVTPDGKVVLFPNPTSGELNIESNEHIEYVYLLDEQGKLASQSAVHGKSGRIDLSSFPDGSYFLRYPKGDGWSADRIILRKG